MRRERENGALLHVDISRAGHFIGERRIGAGYHSRLVSEDEESQDTGIGAAITLESFVRNGDGRCDCWRDDGR